MNLKTVKKFKKHIEKISLIQRTWKRLAGFKKHFIDEIFFFFKHN